MAPGSWEARPGIRSSWGYRGSELGSGQLKDPGAVIGRFVFVKMTTEAWGQGGANDYSRI